MSTSMTNDTYVDVERACAIWQEYQREHDVSGRIGMTAGIDPVTGHVWFGDSIPDVVARMKEEKAFTPLYYVRVGHDHYFRKGGHK